MSKGALYNLGELHCQLTNIKRILRTGTRIQGDFYQIKLTHANIVLGVSKIRGTPKSILIGLSSINHPF